MGVAANNISTIRGPSTVTSSRNEAVSIERDAPSLMIRETDNSESLVANPQVPSLEMALQPPLTSFSTYFQPGTENGMAQQDHLQQLHLQVQEVLGKIQESDQKIQEVFGTIREADRQQEEILGTTQQTDPQAQSIQRLQQQLGEALEKTQQMDQQAKESQGRYEQLLQQRDQETLQAPALVQCRAQAILTESSKNLPALRLFIVLPEPTAVIDGQKGPHLQLRLHFLCECDAHKVTKNGKGLYEVHLVTHPSYDLVDQDEFIDKYGSYLLTMMYMVKYGAKAGGLVAQPLLGLKSATEDDETRNISILSGRTSALSSMKRQHTLKVLSMQPTEGPSSQFIRIWTSRRSLI
ncbi:MAG: hypothetical protein J3Q66DRAFT_444096 [Benniella sp.]|nr:MAG: hypothetical protein J3Q66DRAFT_444096 [Benniella sp.]